MDELVGDWIAGPVGDGPADHSVWAGDYLGLESADLLPEKVLVGEVVIGCDKSGGGSMILETASFDDRDKVPGQFGFAGLGEGD